MAAVSTAEYEVVDKSFNPENTRQAAHVMVFAR